MTDKKGDNHKTYTNSVMSNMVKEHEWVLSKTQKRHD